MSVVWFVLILILLAFAIFAGESTLRMRSDVKLIREVVLDLRSKLAPTTATARDSTAVDDEDAVSSSPGDDPVQVPPQTVPAEATPIPTASPAAAVAPEETEHFRDWHP